jgi:hypothetical protein
MRPGDHERGALAMSAIPLHLQRKFEQRWAARFVPPVSPNSPKVDGAKAARPTSTRRRAARQKPKKNLSA